MKRMRRIPSGPCLPGDCARESRPPTPACSAATRLANPYARGASSLRVRAMPMLCAIAGLLISCVVRAQSSVPSDPPPGAWPEEAGAVIGLHFDAALMQAAGLELTSVPGAIDWPSPRRLPGNFSSAALPLRVEPMPVHSPEDLQEAGPDFFGALANRRLSFQPGALELEWRNAGRASRANAAWSSIVPHGTGLRSLHVVDPSGAAWLTLSNPHRWHDAGRRRMHWRNLDVALHVDAARRLGKPALAGVVLGAADLWIDDAALAATGGAPRISPKGSPACNPPVWPSPSAPADVELSRVFDIAALRCRNCNGVDAGALVVAPAAELANVGGADIAWYPKLSGDFPPYGNDQHPFLIWNLYRLDADGSLRQIGASGVKHAFFAQNFGCGCDPAFVLYRGCRDIYAASTNDSPDDIGPRAEILPAPAVWARCGSIYDADCNAIFDNGSGASDDFQYRLQAAERDLGAERHPGARWFMEAWYVVRDDSNRANSVSHREVLPAHAQGVWMFPVVGEPRAGAVGDAWLAPGSAGPLFRESRVTTVDGTFSLAVRVRRSGSGYRYVYVLTNIDAVVAVTSGATPNLRLVAESGLALLRLPVSPLAVSQDFEFHDGDDASPSGDDWVPTPGAGTLAFAAPHRASTQRWGRSYTFAFTSSAAPAPANATVGRGDPADNLATVLLSTLAPTDGSGDRLLVDGFEGSDL